MLVENQTQCNNALASIRPHPAIVQEVASDAGQGPEDLCFVRRDQGGGHAHGRAGNCEQLQTRRKCEASFPYRCGNELAQQVIKRFADADAPLAFAGIDLIYHLGSPVINEVEDVVGSRMLYKVSDMDIAELYLREMPVSDYK